MKANGGIRTYNLRFTKPESENANNQLNQALTEGPENVLASRLALLAEKHPDLALVVEHWPNLPEHIKTTIKTLVETARK
jgi:hypothetical protein